MADVTLSKAVRSNLLHLQNTSRMMDITQERLATGKRVNSALDGPTNFFTAASLQGRAADISTLLDSMGNGIQIIEAADNALSAITEIVENMQSTLRQARQDKSFQTASLPMAESRSGELTLSGGGFPAGETFTVPLTNAVPAAVTASADYALMGTQGAQSVGFTGANFDTPDAPGGVTAAGTFAPIPFDDANDQLTVNVSVDGTPQSLTFNQAEVQAVLGAGVTSIGSVEDLAEVVNSKLTGAVASNDGGALRLESLTSGATSVVNVTGVTYSDNGAAAAAFNDTGFDGTAGQAGIAGTAGDSVTFDLEIDGITLPVTINKTIADAATGGNDGNIDTDAEMQAAFRAAITAAGFDPDSFEVSATGGTLTIGSGSRGPASSVSIANAGATGTTAIDVATNAGINLANPTPANVDAQEAEFTINYGGTTLDVALDGDVHTDVSLAIQHINDEIAAHNAANPADQIDVTAIASKGRIVLRGPADGTGPAVSVYDTTTGSGDTDIVFGTARQIDPPSEANGPPKTVDQLVNDINGNPEFKNIVRASNDRGNLRIENLSTADLDIAGLTGGAVSGGSGATSVGGNDYRASMARQFNDLRTEFDRLADDAHYGGINLLRGDELKIVFNENGTSSIAIQARNARGEARAINVANLNIRTLTEQDMNLDETIDELLANLQMSLNEVRAQASDLGSSLSVVQNRQNFTKEMINTLETGAANLTLADSNEEAANMLALQTRQQLSQTALSLASQADQAVLRLFG